MIYKTFIGLFILATLLYYIVCLLEVFKVIKWTSKKTTIKFPEFLIPFYYFIKK